MMLVKAKFELPITLKLRAINKTKESSTQHIQWPEEINVMYWGFTIHKYCKDMNNCSMSYSNCWNYNIGTIIFINIMWYVNRILSSQNIIQQLPDCNEDETTDSLLNYKWITSNTYWRLVTYTFFDVISSVWERYYGNFGNGVEECTGSGNIFYELLEMMMPCILINYVWRNHY